MKRPVMQRPDAAAFWLGLAAAEGHTRSMSNGLPLAVCAWVPLAAVPAPLAVAATAPNIVYVLCDDLGYGDIHCLNPQRGKFATPHADRLAAQGMIFLDAHSGSSVCTPTRYGILTGRYAWRTRLQAGVLNGDSGPLIAAQRLTVPAWLRQHGYATACIGKWHLGMTLPRPLTNDDIIRDGPVSRGFDEFFGIAASLDMPPFAWIENDHFTEAPTATKTWLRNGPAAPGFEAVDVLPTLAAKAVGYIRRQASSNKPFFLYLALASPHTPVVPSQAWQGKSGLGAYGDFVMQTDAVLGEVLTALDAGGLSNNTLVIFTSDNGCSPAAKVDALEKAGHFPSATFRGYKADIWDGGHRVPFLVRWPGVVAAASRCRQTVCLTDLLATCAELVGAPLPADAGEDSVSILPLLKGGDAAVREVTVHHSIQGMFALREGPNKIIFGGGSGGWSKGATGPVQFYDMAADAGERDNLQAARAADVARLTRRMEEIIAAGRSTKGPPQKNDVEVKLWKNGPPSAVPTTVIPSAP